MQGSEQSGTFNTPAKLKDDSVSSIDVENGPYYVWFASESLFDKRCEEWKEFLGCTYVFDKRCEKWKKFIGAKRSGTLIKLTNGVDRIYNVKHASEYRYYPYSFPAGEYKSFLTLFELKEYLRPVIEYTHNSNADNGQFILFQDFLKWAYPEIKCSTLECCRVSSSPCTMRMIIPSVNYEYTLYGLSQLTAKDMLDSFIKNYVVRKIHLPHQLNKEIRGLEFEQDSIIQQNKWVIETAQKDLNLEPYVNQCLSGAPVLIEGTNLLFQKNGIEPIIKWFNTAKRQNTFYENKVLEEFSTLANLSGVGMVEKNYNLFYF